MSIASFLWAPLLKTARMVTLTDPVGRYVKVVLVEVVIVEQGQNQLPISQNQLTIQLKKAPWLQPPQLRPPLRGTDSRFSKGGCSGNRVLWFTLYYRLFYHVILPPSTVTPSDCTPL